MIGLISACNCFDENAYSQRCACLRACVRVFYFKFICRMTIITFIDHLKKSNFSSHFLSLFSTIAHSVVDIECTLLLFLVRNQYSHVVIHSFVPGVQMIIAIRSIHLYLFRSKRCKQYLNKMNGTEFVLVARNSENLFKKRIQLRYYYRRRQLRCSCDSLKCNKFKVIKKGSRQLP